MAGQHRWGLLGHAVEFFAAERSSTQCLGQLQQRSSGFGVGGGAEFFDLAAAVLKPLEDGRCRD